MGRKTSQIRNDMEETRDHMADVLDEISAKLDVRAFAKRNAVLLGSAAVVVGLAIGISVWRISVASSRSSGRGK